MFLHPAINAHLMTPLPYRNKRKCSCRQSNKFALRSPVYLPRVKGILAVVPCLSKPERGDGVHTVLCL